MENQFSKKFLTTLQDKGLFDSNNYGDNFLGVGKSVDFSEPDTGNYKSAMRVMNKKPAVGMNHGDGSSVAFPKANVHS